MPITATGSNSFNQIHKNAKKYRLRPCRRTVVFSEVFGRFSPGENLSTDCRLNPVVSAVQYWTFYKIWVNLIHLTWINRLGQPVVQSDFWVMATHISWQKSVDILQYVQWKYINFKMCFINSREFIEHFSSQKPSLYSLIITKNIQFGKQ